MNITIIMLGFLTLPHVTGAAEIDRAQYLMGTVCEVKALGREASKLESAVTLAFKEIARLEQVMSTYRPDSEVSELNRLGGPRPRRCSADLMEILRLSRVYSSRTGGAFDVTVGPLIKLWDIRGEGSIPEDIRISSTLESVGFEHLHLNESSRTVSFGAEGMALDFGGIGKGYALDRAADVLKESGVEAALLNFGGNILAVGAPPGKTAWIIDVSDPGQPQRNVATLRVRDAAVSTSSQFERSKKTGGRRIGHILDPQSGRPVEFEGSVTVIARTATEADALSTALFVMGPEKGLAFLETQDSGAAFFLIITGTAGEPLKIKRSSRCARYDLSFKGDKP